MATELYKGTFVWRLRNGGWSESFYVNADSLNEATASLRVVSWELSSFRGAGVVLEALKVNSVDTPFISRIVPGSEMLTNVAVGDEVGDRSDVAWNCAHLKLLSGDRRYQRNFLLRGIRDFDIQFSGATGNPAPPTASFSGRLLAFAAILTGVKAVGARMRTVSKEPADSTKRTITNITRDLPTSTYTVTAPGHGFVAGDRVRIGKLIGQGIELYSRGKTFKLRGSHIVGVTDANTFTVTLGGTTTDVLAIIQFGYAVKQKYGSVAISTVEFVKFSKRNTGRPLFLLRGRRSGRR